MRLEHSIHREYRSVIQIIKSPTRPRPVSRFLHQTPRDGIAMHIVEFFSALLRAPDIQVIASALPDAKVSMMMNGDGKFHPPKHSLAPRIGQIIAQILEDKFRRPLFQLLQDVRGIELCGRPNQNVKMFRHQNISNDFEIEFASQFVQGADQPPLEPFRVEESSAAVGAARNVMQMVETVIVFLARHPNIIRSSKDRIHQKSMYAPPPIGGPAALLAV